MNPRATIFLIATALLLMSAGPARAVTARVTYLEGSVFVGASEQGPWQPLALSRTIDVAGFLRTGDDGIVELTLADASLVRLAPGSLYMIQEASFLPEQPRRFKAKLFFGKLWAKVKRAASKPAGSFETHTPTAIIGVRGTVYNLAAARDRSAEIFVYEGVVGVGPPVLVDGAAREEIAWPAEISEQRWEEIILAKLQRLRIGADGRPGQVRDFDPREVRDRWVQFNQSRDARIP